MQPVHVDLPKELWLILKKSRKNVLGKDESIPQVIHRWGVKAGEIKNERF